jgi:hypothetical protein
MSSDMGMMVSRAQEWIGKVRASVPGMAAAPVR